LVHNLAEDEGYMVCPVIILFKIRRSFERGEVNLESSLLHQGNCYVFSKVIPETRGKEVIADAANLLRGEEGVRTEEVRLGFDAF
jgi:hypothetical protein